jgi:hypothetical protein
MDLNLEGAATLDLAHLTLMVRVKVKKMMQ